jgi:hypothetical protein
MNIAENVRVGSFLVQRISGDDHLRVQSSKGNAPKINRDSCNSMLRVVANRGTFVRAVGVLCIALVCMMGAIQAAHSHPENSTTSHHTCTICATAHVVNTQTVAFAPVLASASLAIHVSEVSPIVRPAITQFIRPPPAF